MENRTTNRVESFHAKIKAFVKPSSSVPTCVSELFKFDAGKHHEASHNRVLNAVRSRYIQWCGLSAHTTNPADCNPICCQHNHI